MATAKTPSKSLAVKKAATGAPATKKPAAIEQAAEVIYGPPTIAQVQRALEEDSKLYFDGEGMGGESILAGTLANATTGADLFAESELEKVENHYGETLQCQAINAVLNSEYVGGLGIYLICTFVDTEGTLFRMAVGQVDPIGKITALHEFGQLPWWVSFELSTKTTKRGFTPVNLVSREPAKKGDRPF